MGENVLLSVDAMGGDAAPRVVVDGLSLFATRRRHVQFLLHGDSAQLAPLVEAAGNLTERVDIRHTDLAIGSADKPAQALRRGKGSSMWNAVEAVKAGEASAGISAGNTGALMAISMLILRKMEGVHRPGMTAIWPTLTGRSVVLDVGANLEATADQLLTYAIMGAAYATAVTGKERPSIGILNIGSEEMKGHPVLTEAAALIKTCGLDLNYQGFVEGDDISAGSVDVVVTDGFTGNVALKTAEGTARLVGDFVKQALTKNLMTKAGAALAMGGLKELKEKMDPSNVNGGVLLGLNGVVVKSHGGTDANGFATALELATALSRSHYREEVEASLARIIQAPAAVAE